MVTEWKIGALEVSGGGTGTLGEWGRGKLATCLTQAVGPSFEGASGEENLKNAEL